MLLYKELNKKQMQSDSLLDKATEKFIEITPVLFY